MNTGHNGRTFANGVRIQSTPEAIRKELQETWKKMRGAEGERYRKNVAEVAGIIRTSSESGGARANMLRLGEYFTDKEQLPAA
jgi:hypothetical protein